MSRLSAAASKSILLLFVAVLLTSATTNQAEAANKHKTVYVVFVKHPEKEVVWFSHSYSSKKAADKKAKQLNKEYWVKVTPVVGKVFYRDGGEKVVGHQIAGIPDKVFAGLTGVNVAKIDLIEKDALVRVRYEEIK